MKTSEILIAARKKIDKEENWTKGFPCRNLEGVPLLPGDPHAHSFCIVGALTDVGIKFGVDYRNGYLALSAELGGERVTDYNDTHTHAEVLELFDKAIASAIEEENRDGA